MERNTALKFNALSDLSATLCHNSMRCLLLAQYRAAKDALFKFNATLGSNIMLRVSLSQSWSNTHDLSKLLSSVKFLRRFGQV